MKSKDGFSLIELLIVIGIIAVLGGVMLTQFSGSTDSAMAAKCMNNMRTLCNAVMAEGSKESYYPSAGPYRYLEIGSTKPYWYQGWIGQTKGAENSGSSYHSDEGENQHYAITNGTIWRTVGGSRSAYVCPAHEKFCKRGKTPTPAWTYVMNSYFGWDNGTPAGDVELGRRGYGGGFFTFRYSTAPKSRSRPLEKVLLFAEMPFANNGVQRTSFSTSADTANDAILQYQADSSEVVKADKCAKSGGECIGFNHKSGKNYSAHVAFADGHCAKLMLPTDANEDNLISLTTWLCTGQEYTFNGSQYQKVTE